MSCLDCQKPLRGGIDTYGDVGEIVEPVRRIERGA